MNIRRGRLLLDLHLLVFADDLRLPDLLLADPGLPVDLAEVVNGKFGIRMLFFEFFTPLMQRQVDPGIQGPRVGQVLHLNLIKPWFLHRDARDLSLLGSRHPAVDLGLDADLLFILHQDAPHLLVAAVHEGGDLLQRQPSTSFIYVVVRSVPQDPDDLLQIRSAVFHPNVDADLGRNYNLREIVYTDLDNEYSDFYTIYTGYSIM